MADMQDSASAPASQPDQSADAFASAFAEKAGREEETPPADKQEEHVPAAEENPSEGPVEEQGSKPFDPWIGLSEEQKSYFESLRHSESSNRGRVASLNRQLQEARAASEAAAQKPKDEGKDDKGGEQEESRAERLKRAAEEYPDAVADLVEEVIDLRSRLENTAPAKPAEGTPPDDEALEKEYVALEEAHPDYRQIGADPAYASWVGSKSEAIKALANSYSAADVASVLTLYKAERAAALSSKQGDDPKPDTNAQRRGRQLEGSRAVENRGAPSASQPAADDFHSAFLAKAKGGR